VAVIGEGELTQSGVDGRVAVILGHLFRKKDFTTESTEDTEVKM
jgi:hypothetical protein